MKLNRRLFNHSIIGCSHHLHMGAILRAHHVRGELSEAIDMVCHGGLDSTPRQLNGCNTTRFCFRRI